MSLIVTADSVTVETSVGPGRARVDFFRGQTLPGDLTEEDRERVLRLGQAVQVDDSPPPAAEFDPATLGQATIDAILGWVIDDPAPPQRAQLALDAETAEKGKNRTTLIDRLKAIIEPPAA